MLLESLSTSGIVVFISSCLLIISIISLIMLKNKDDGWKIPFWILSISSGLIGLILIPLLRIDRLDYVEITNHRMIKGDDKR